jgi:acetyl esterase/lipase
MAKSIPKPPYDPELALAPLQTPTYPSSLDPRSHSRNEETTQHDQPTRNRNKQPPHFHEEHTILSLNGTIKLSIFRLTAAKSTGPKPAIYWMHGGGFVAGNYFQGMAQVVEWVETLDGVGISVEYRQAPEYLYPVPVKDRYAGLIWVGANIEKLRIDSRRLMVAGSSAGGALAAAVTLIVRDRSGPEIVVQCLLSPILDDRL